MRTLNAAYRHRDESTDVLSFAYVQVFDDADIDAGDIVLSHSHILGQAEEYGHTPEAETYRLIVHALFHLAGYDHETDEEYAQMHEREKRVLAVLQKHHITLRA